MISLIILLHYHTKLTRILCELNHYRNYCISYNTDQLWAIHTCQARQADQSACHMHMQWKGRSCQAVWQGGLQQPGLVTINSLLVVLLLPDIPHLSHPPPPPSPVPSPPPSLSHLTSYLNTLSLTIALTTHLTSSPSPDTPSLHSSLSHLTTTSHLPLPSPHTLTIISHHHLTLTFTITSHSPSPSPHTLTKTLGSCSFLPSTKSCFLRQMVPSSSPKRPLSVPAANMAKQDSKIKKRKQRSTPLHTTLGNPNC